MRPVLKALNLDLPIQHNNWLNNLTTGGLWLGALFSGGVVLVAVLVAAIRIIAALTLFLLKQG
jgi:hypothetical protein